MADTTATCLASESSSVAEISARAPAILLTGELRSEEIVLVSLYVMSTKLVDVRGAPNRGMVDSTTPYGAPSPMATSSLSFFGLADPGVPPLVLFLALESAFFFFEGRLEPLGR